MSMTRQLWAQWQQRKLTRPQLASMFAPPDTERWVAIDCEMTGLNPKQHHLLSVAAIHINGNHIDTRVAALQLTVKRRSKKCSKSCCNL